MVAFAGRKYAAKSFPAFVANGTYTVTSFTLVREDPESIMISILSLEVLWEPIESFVNAGARV